MLTRYRMLFYSLIFIISGFFGWAVDTGYRSITMGHYESATVVPFFSLIFASASLLLTVLFRKTSFFWSVFLGTLFCVGIELVSGFVLLKFFHERLWNYKSNPFDLYGFIDLLHSAYWFLLVLLYRLFYKYWLKRKDKKYLPKRS